MDREGKFLLSVAQTEGIGNASRSLLATTYQSHKPWVKSNGCLVFR